MAGKSVDWGTVLAAGIGATGPITALVVGYRQKKRVKQFDMIEYSIDLVTKDNERLREEAVKRDARITSLEQENRSLHAEVDELRRQYGTR